MAEWRECKLAGDPWKPPAMRDDEFPGDEFRDCHWLKRVVARSFSPESSIYEPWHVLPAQCARCPVPALVEAVRAAQPIVECEEARHDILLKCTQVEGATEEEKRLREKHLRGKRREAYRARKAIEAALDRAGEEARDA